MLQQNYAAVGKKQTYSSESESPMRNRNPARAHTDTGGAMRAIFGAGKYRWLNFARSHIGSGLLMRVAAAPLPRSLELFRGVSCFRLALQGNGRTGEFHACDLPHVGLSGIM
ncbi:MAG TPA: hypothetical protein VN831_28005, partial [Bradyrhizobium sp.]|nr:hypothetical protein [Bradyrhizobium sp.]